MPNPDRVIGWRSWQVSNGFLLSITARFVWPPKVIIPVDDEGYYTFKTQGQALESNYHAAGGVLGPCALWGRICEYTDGYRAQFCYPIKIYHFDDLNDYNLLALHQYGVPVEPYGTDRETLEDQIRRARETMWQTQSKMARQQRDLKRARYQALMDRAKALGVWDQIEKAAEEAAKNESKP